jgi:CRP/FNR family cyclic AMP-dependent transcriptional regulator
MNSSGNLELKTIAALAPQRTSRRVKAGEIIFRDGDLGASLFGVLSGQIELSSGGVCVETIGPGSCFGASALVEPDHFRYGTATALTDVELLEMNREEFLFAMQELPMFALEMLHDLEERLQQLKSRIIES